MQSQFGVLHSTRYGHKVKSSIDPFCAPIPLQIIRAVQVSLFDPIFTLLSIYYMISIRHQNDPMPAP
jgi:hypothetical protein